MGNHFLVTYDEHVMDSFEFESGAVVENANVEYATRGTPKYDDEGFITNAIVFCPSMMGERSILKNCHDYIMKNSDFESNEFFFIIITPLGTPGSCSPSTTGLKYKFPEYSFRDRVNFKRKFISQNFKIKQILGILGEDLGGFEAYTWACEYPDEMKFILVFGSSFKTYGARYALSKGLDEVIGLIDGYYEDTYNVSLSNGIVTLNKLLFAHYIPKKILHELSNDELDFLMENYVEDGLYLDVYDFKRRNDSILNYDVEDKLGNIKAKTMVITSEGLDGYFSAARDTLPLKDLIEDSKILIYDSKIEHFGDMGEISIIGDEVISFINQFKN